MALIDLSNYDTKLVQSTDDRAGTPDGNIFFDTANGLIEIITAEELATVDLTSKGGGATDPNPISNQDGIRFEALYAFENQERRIDENLRKYDRYFKGTFKYGGAYEIINSRKFASTDRKKIRSSGWIERAADGGVDRIYYGVKSLGNIESASQPYYQLAAGGAPTNYSKVGDIDEAIQVFGSTANTPTDATAGTFDSRTYLSSKVRTFGYNYDEKKLADSGVTEMGGYFSGFALGESSHLTSGGYALADVYGGAKISPWTGMSLEKLSSAQLEGGFNQADGNFTWVLNNTANGSLNQCVAFLDALAQTDDDIDSGTVTITNGKRVNTWYTYDAQGRIVTRSGADALGLFIENIPLADQQRIVFTDDAGALKTYPFTVAVEVTVGATAVADTNAWYHAFFEADYGTTGAVTVVDNVSDPVKGNVATDQITNMIKFGFDYDGDTVGGTAGTAKDVVFLCEGDGGATQAKTLFTLSRTAVISPSCAPGLETNV